MGNPGSEIVMVGGGSLAGFGDGLDPDAMALAVSARAEEEDADFGAGGDAGVSGISLYLVSRELTRTAVGLALELDGDFVLADRERTLGGFEGAGEDDAAFGGGDPSTSEKLASEQCCHQLVSVFGNSVESPLPPNDKCAVDELDLCLLALDACLFEQASEHHRLAFVAHDT